MSDTIETITVTGEHVSVSLLVWRRFKKAMPGMVERVHSINPGLAAMGEFIPVGTKVRVPIPDQRQVTEITPVRLWG